MITLNTKNHLREVFSREFKLVWGLTLNSQDAITAAKYAVAMEGGVDLPQIEVKIEMVGEYVKGLVVINDYGYLTKTIPSAEAGAFADEMIEKIFRHLPEDLGSKVTL